MQIIDGWHRKSKFLKDIEKQKRRKNTKTTEKKKRGDTTVSSKDTVGKKDRSKSKDTGPSTLTKVLVRPLLTLRSVKFNYRENLGTVVPGIVMEESPEFLGLSSGFNAPGWAFVAGWQPDITLGDQNNWLYQAADNGWITNSPFQNNQVLQKKTQDYDAKVALEPFKDFKVDVDFKKKFSDDTFENFKTVKDGSSGFDQLARRNVGSFEVTYSGLKTFFDDDVIGMFETFKANRIIISDLLNESGVEHSQDGNLYQEGYGAVQSNVIIPSFLSAYTGRAISSDWIKRDTGGETTTGLVYEISRGGYIPRPNWTLRYNGLKNIPMFQNLLSSFSMSHSYKSSLRVNQFRTNQDFDFNDINLINPGTGNYYSRFELPLVQVSEQFSPLLGIQMKTKKELNLNVEYRKGRTLDLNTDVLGNITEKRTEAFTVGIGWTKQGVNIGFLTGDKKGSRKRKGDDDKDADPEKKKEQRKGLGRGGAVNNNRPRDLTFNIDFSMQDDKTYIHNYSQDIVDNNGNRGQKSYRFNPSVDYNVNENLNLRLFLDYETTLPVNTATGITRITRYFSGLTARFNLN